MFIGELRVYAGIQALSGAMAQHWGSLAKQAVAARGKFHVALSGGTTPGSLYRHLAALPPSDQIPWDRTHVYFSDERAVPPDHVDSNYRMACETLLHHVPVPAAQIHRMQGEMADAQEAAVRYTRTLTAHLPLSAQGITQFDLLLLGIGPDGHTASLFPGTAVLYERARLVEAVYVDKLSAWRITITLPVIDHARHVVILASGRGKAAIIREVLTTRHTPPYPIQLINPQGTLEWYLDEAAAALLPKELRS